MVKKTLDVDGSTERSIRRYHARFRAKWLNTKAVDSAFRLLAIKYNSSPSKARV